ncbi:SDR family NAD(P)-dependent oxidoreductase [Taklimakanibacter deserti]|uniref:SDR family NAD(P)-dependent oxidoreductase n=1 Tax=Taklimakanibacter deserti TaxID=2267839 RepID=UPI000E65C9C1
MQFADRFKGRVAVITGGASGIGFAVAERILGEGGAAAIWDVDAKAGSDAAAKLGRNALAVAVDVSDETSVNQAVAQTVKAFGHIDVLVTSAAITGPNATTWDYPPEKWRQVIDINVNGVYYCCRAIVPYMQAQKYGRIVNIASIAGKEGNPNAPAYSTSKAAVIGLTKSLGKELAKTRITANCVTPAAVKTPIFDQMTQAHIDFMLSKIPMGRFGLVDEVASLVTWLASEECSFSTGAVFDVSGGRATY